MFYQISSIIFLFSCIPTVHSNRTKRLIYGMEVDTEIFPMFKHTVSMYCQRSYDYCDGALISLHWVLTSKTGIDKLQNKCSGESIMAAAGHPNLEKCRSINVSSIYRYYTTQPKLHDLALAKLLLTFLPTDGIGVALTYLPLEADNFADNVEFCNHSTVSGRGRLASSADKMVMEWSTIYVSSCPAKGTPEERRLSEKRNGNPTLFCVNRNMTNNVLFGPKLIYPEDSGQAITCNALEGPNQGRLYLVAVLTPWETEENVEYAFATNVAYYYTWIRETTGILVPFESEPVDTPTGTSTMSTESDTDVTTEKKKKKKSNENDGDDDGGKNANTRTKKKHKKDDQGDNEATTEDFLNKSTRVCSNIHVYFYIYFLAKVLFITNY